MIGLLRSLMARVSGPERQRFAPLKPAHAGAVAALHAASFARGWDAPEIARMLMDRAVIADGVFLGGARQPSGFILSRIAADEAEILTIAVDPDCRGRGLARLLLGHHAPELARRGVGRLFLEVEEDNAPALALYRRAGFRQVGERAGYYPKPDGSRARALVMRLEL